MASPTKVTWTRRDHKTEKRVKGRNKNSNIKSKKDGTLKLIMSLNKAS